MERIGASTTHVSRDGPYVKETLNGERRRREMMRVMGENEALLRRIQNRRPVYSAAEFDRAHNEKEARLKSISRYPHQPRTVAIAHDPYAPPGAAGGTALHPDREQSAHADQQQLQQQQQHGKRPQPPAGSKPGGRGAPCLAHSNNSRGNKQHNSQQQQYAEDDGDEYGYDDDAAAAAHNTCVYSSRGVRIGGIMSTLSVYERLRPFRLDFLARDEAGRSTLAPVSLPLRTLRQVCHFPLLQNNTKQQPYLHQLELYLLIHFHDLFHI